MQVWMGMYVLSGTQASSISHLSLFFFWLELAWMPFICFFSYYFRGMENFMQLHEGLGVMTVYVYNPHWWTTITDFRGMAFARAQNEKDSYRFELVCKWCKGFGMGIWQTEHKSRLVLCFQNKNFQDFELGTCTTSCHHITRINKQDCEQS